MRKLDFRIWLNADQYISSGSYAGKDYHITGLSVFTRDKLDKYKFKNERSCTSEEVEWAKQQILNVFQEIK